ncbi:hypothetical protein A0H81_07649 [Grifola frondosa]|uniref:Uncharacterized protein n=1 Tax=Grifola frondosa TaxID=5627 RepID=A0A1C7M6K3_GRIFR|nr:hypothetical protein A0H81_07649 [Grifola frondosa]
MSSNAPILHLGSLPVELLYEIQSYALSPSLPLISRCFFLQAKRTASVRALGLVSIALRYPICTQPVLETIFRSSEYPITPPWKSSNYKIFTELPRRLFRSLTPQHDEWTEDDEPLPFLRYLYDHPRIPPPAANSFDGYALTKAVYMGFRPLVRFLLDHGASPACKNNLAVTVAIRRKDLALVRMLIERDGAVAASGSPDDGEDRIERQKGRGVKRKATETPRASKRRRLEDRIGVTQEMLKVAVKYCAHHEQADKPPLFAFGMIDVLRSSRTLVFANLIHNSSLYIASTKIFGKSYSLSEYNWHSSA